MQDLLYSNNIDEILKVANDYYFSSNSDEERFSFQLYKRAEELEPENAFVINKLGNCYFHGVGVAADASKAKQYYQKAASMNFPASQFNLAGMLADENNVDCIALYEKSTSEGDGEGFYKIAELYRDGRVVSQNNNMFIQYLEKSVSLGFSSAKLDLAVELLNGAIIPVDIEKGIALMIQAANENNAVACGNMSNIFRTDKYAPRNMDKAIYWAKRASELGEHGHIIDIAVDYYLGKDRLECNMSLAAELFKFAADNGSSIGMENIAICYNKGDGVPQNKEKAKEYFIKAAHCGSKKAYSNLMDLCSDEEFIQIMKDVAEDPGYYSAMIVLYRCYINGDRIEKNEELAKHYLLSALEGEYSEALTIYGFARYYGNLGYSIDVNEAINSWQKASEKGDNTATHTLGLVFWEGQYVPRDIEKAKHYFEMSASNGNTDALIRLGNIYNTDNAPKEALQRAISYYEKALEQGNPEGACKIGSIFDSDNSLGKDYKKAAHYYNMAMEKGNLEAQSRLGAMYYYGVLGERSADKGISLLQDALSKGHKSAESFLSKMYYSKSDVIDQRRAFTFNLSQANKGNVSAQYWLSCFFEDGIGVQCDNVAANKWLKIAADNGEVSAMGLFGAKAYDNHDYVTAYQYLSRSSDAGNEVAMYFLSRLLKDGAPGVPRDFNKAVFLLQKSAEKGCVDAQSDLGIMYALGEGVPKNAQTAVYLFTKAADQGDSDSQKNLGIIYKNGDGVPKNINLSLYWFTQASNQGNIQAKVNLADFYKDGIGVQQNYYTAINLLQEVINSGDNEYYQGCMFDLAFIYDTINREDLAFPIWEKLAYMGLCSAQYNLGQCYSQGKGTPRDMKQAKYWWKKAADQGDNDARMQLQANRWKF